MTFWGRLGALFAAPIGMPLEQPRPATRFGGVEIPPEMLEAMTAGGAIAPRIRRAEALQVPAVLRARNLICGSLGTLPVRVHGPDRRVITDVTYLVPAPDPDIPSSVVMAQTVEDLLFEGVAWWRVTRFGWHNFPVEARHVPVECVHVAPTGGLMPSQRQISPDQPYPVDGQVYIDGIPVPDNEIIRFDSPNPPLLVAAARAIRTCLALERATARYADNPLPLGYFAPREPGADPLSDEEIQEILDDWATANATRSWGYVNGALEAKALQWSPEQLQLAAQRQHAVLEIARATGLDAEDLQVSTTSRTYANSEQRRQDLNDFTLSPYTVAIQDRLSMRDILPRGYVSRIDFAGFLRGDTKTRMDTYKIGKGVGAYLVDEIRELENRPALTPAQQAALAPKPPEAPKMSTDGPEFIHRDLWAEVQVERDRREALEREVAALREVVEKLTARVDQDERVQQFDFSAPPSTVERIQFDADADTTFQVDTDRRTITGLILPWGKVARNASGRWRFAPDSVSWSEASRIKLNQHHDRHDLVGVATRLQSASRGLMATFKIGRGPDGDRVLEKADDRILDGFSVEVDFEDMDSWQPDPTDESVRLVRQATLRGVALTGTPAFDDARVTGVKAERENGGAGMGAPTKTAPAGSTAPASTQDGTAFDFDGFVSGLTESLKESQKNLVEALGASVGDSLTAGIKAALENLHDPQGDGPQPVRAARFQVTREAPVYTLDGRGPCLVRDAWYADREHDDDAKERLRRFAQQSNEVQKIVAAHIAFQAQPGAQFAPVTTGGAAAIIPPGYRSDLFVPKLAQQRPFVNACSRGTIANATPFVVPVFGTSGGVGDHVEGTNPADGTLTFTTKTVTPGAISGKLPLTREIVDSSNPAIDQIALAAMNEDYSRQTEAKVYALLNGANGQGGVITAGFVPSGAQVVTTTGGSIAAGTFGGVELLDGVRAALALYSFRRFAAPNRALLSQEATSAFATAKDTTNRPLLPSVGATNAAGLGNAVDVGWFVDGLAHVPAWAITGNAAGDADVFTLNSADVWAWESPVLSFRFEEKQGPAIIELALFGYFATHLLRPVGLSAIRHTRGA